MRPAATGAFSRSSTTALRRRWRPTLCASARAFFEQPAEAKQRISRTRENPWGYYDKELTKNVRDWKEVWDLGPADGKAIAPQWPDGLPGFRAAVEAYAQTSAALGSACWGRCRRISACPRTTSPSGSAARTRVSSGSTTIRVCPAPAAPEGLDQSAAGHLGVNYHTDAGALTLLLQDDQPGLEVFREGRWYLVEPCAGALVINIGDIVQVWSNDRYPAALHRVLVSSETSRVSARPISSIPTTVRPMRPCRRWSTSGIRHATGRSTGASFACGVPTATTPTTVRKSRSATTSFAKVKCMSFIDTIPPDEAGGEVREMYERQEASWGYVPNYAQTFSLRPEVLARWARLLAEIRRPMSDRRFELVTTVAACVYRHTACSLAHGKKLAELIGESEVLAVVTNGDSPALTDAEREMVALRAQGRHGRLAGDGRRRGTGSGPTASTTARSSTSRRRSPDAHSSPSCWTRWAASRTMHSCACRARCARH